MAEAENEELVKQDEEVEELVAIKAQLEEERKARAEIEEAMMGKDTRIAELESQLSEAKQSSEVFAAELASVKEAKDQLAEALTVAKGKYLEMSKALNPSIPEGIISGESIEEIDQSIERGKVIVEAVRTNVESEAAATKVPAGAPIRGGILFEGMSPREKIAYGIQKKGGIS